jgi:hypothetical protein
VFLDRMPLPCHTILNRIGQAVCSRPDGKLVLTKLVDRAATAHLPWRAGVVDAIVNADVVTDWEEQ